MSDDRELWRWWEAVGSAVPSDGVNIALWRGRLPRLEASGMHDAARRGWLGASDVRAVERQATLELASRVAARRLLRRMIIAAHGGCAPDEVRIEVRCVHCHDTAHGAPTIVAPALALHRLSTAATHDAFLLGLAAASIGVDVESPSAAADLTSRSVGLAVPGWAAVERACRPRTNVVDIWTAFEALTKATGLGVSATPPTIVEALETHQLRWLEDEPDVVSCIATAEPEPAVAIVELHLTSAGVSAD